MARSRLSNAIDTGLVQLPDHGDIAVFRPTAAADLSALPGDRLEIIQGFYPDHQAFLARGFRVAVVADGTYSAAVVFLPRSKSEAHGLIVRALAVTGGGPVVVDGQKTDAIDSILKDCRAHGGDVSGVYAKTHGKVFTLSGGDFSDWAILEPARNGCGFITQAGVFSAAGVDRGSAVLADALPADIAGKIADFGAGWGYLSHRILTSKKVTECHLFEAEHCALDCARQNIVDARAQFHWADVRDFRAGVAFDHIVMNPPFHTSRAPNPELGRAFITAATRHLSRRGVVWLVANRHLPYEQHLADTFKEVAEVAGGASYKVFRASVPRPQKS